MGKVNKKELVGLVFGDGEKIRRRSVVLAEERVREKAGQKVNGDVNGHAK